MFHRTYSNLTSFFFFFCDHKKIEVFQWLSKSKFLSFMIKVNPSNRNKTTWDLFLWDKFKFHIWHHFSLVAKYQMISMNFIIGIFQTHFRTEHKQVKWNNAIVFFLVYRVVHYLNGFWRLLIDKVYLENEW